MASSSASLHVSPSKLRPETIDHHRAVVSLMEELEALDWYDQRVDATDDPELRAILIHNRDEEKEHAAMVLEWIRRRDPRLDEELRKYLFFEGSISELAEAERAAEEQEAAGGATPSSNGDGSLGIGSLRGDGYE